MIKLVNDGSKLYVGLFYFYRGWFHETKICDAGFYLAVYEKDGNILCNIPGLTQALTGMVMTSWKNFKENKVLFHSSREPFTLCLPYNSEHEYGMTKDFLKGDGVLPCILRHCCRREDGYRLGIMEDESAEKLAEAIISIVGNMVEGFELEFHNSRDDWRLISQLENKEKRRRDNVLLNMQS